VSILNANILEMVLFLVYIKIAQSNIYFFLCHGGMYRCCNSSVRLASGWLVVLICSREK
jgi:hypothetical protein